MINTARADDLFDDNIIFDNPKSDFNSIYKDDGSVSKYYTELKSLDMLLKG